MGTAANLLVILIFLAAFYTFLGLLCAVAEKARELVARPHQRRRVRRGTKRRTPRRGAAILSEGSCKPRSHGSKPWGTQAHPSVRIPASRPRIGIHAQPRRLGGLEPGAVRITEHG